MKLSLPRSENHSQLRVTARSTMWSTQVTLDNSHLDVDIALPAGVVEDDVEAFVEFLTNADEVDTTKGATVLKTRKRQRRAKPVT